MSSQALRTRVGVRLVVWSSVRGVRCLQVLDMEPSVAFCRNRDGRRIGYMTWGDGPVLVVPPGWVSHLELQWHYLGMERVLWPSSPSRFGSCSTTDADAGLSERVRDDFTLDAEVADLETVIDEVAPGEPVSLLGRVAGRPDLHRVRGGAPDARDAPRAVRRVPARRRGRAARACARASSRWSARAGESAPHALASIFVPGRRSGVSRKNLARFQREAATKEMAAALLESVYRFDVADLLAAVRAPTLVIHRRGDRAIPSRFAAELAAGIAGCAAGPARGRHPLSRGSATGSRSPTLIEDFVARTHAAARAHRRAAGVARRGRAAVPARALPRESEPEQRVRAGSRIAQIGEPADLPVPGPSGVYRLPDARVDAVARQAAALRRARSGGARRSDRVPRDERRSQPRAARDRRSASSRATTRMILVLGGYHDETTRTNVCTVLGPDGVLWQQRKHIPALLRSGGGWIDEPIETTASPIYVVATTHVGRIAIAICRDFLDLDLRVALKNAEPPVDLVINPAFSR